MVKLRDFTDYRMAIYGASEHTTTDIHIRFLSKPPALSKMAQVKYKAYSVPNAKVRKLKLPASPITETERIINFDNPILLKLQPKDEIDAIKYNGFKYLFESQRDRAYLTRKAAWVKWKSKHPIASLREIFRAKKIGYLIFSEPCDHKCSICVHNSDDKYICPTEVEAFHHSLIRLPSGRLRSEPLEYVTEDGVKRLSDPETISPYELKVKIENRLYRQQRGTVKYGLQKLFSMNWKIWVVIGVVVIVMVLYFEHLIPGM